MAIQRDRDFGETSDIPVYRISGFKKADEYFLKAEDLLTKNLNKLGLLEDNLVYRAFDPRNLDYVLQNGFDSPHSAIDFCEIVRRGDKVFIEGNLPLAEYLEEARGESKSAMFSVYERGYFEENPEYDELADDPSSFVETEEDVPPMYVFKDPINKKRALRGVVIIEDWERVG